MEIDLFRLVFLDLPQLIPVFHVPHCSYDDVSSNISKVAPENSMTNTLLPSVSITGSLAKETSMFLPSTTQKPALRTSTPADSTYVHLPPGSEQSPSSSPVSLGLLTLDQSQMPPSRSTTWASLFLPLSQRCSTTFAAGFGQCRYIPPNWGRKTRVGRRWGIRRAFSQKMKLCRTIYKKLLLKE